MVQIRHPGFDRDGDRAGKDDLGVVDASQDQDGGIGLPEDCAEATIKDFGVIATDAGWDLYVGGNGGIKVRVTDLLAKVTTEDEVLEYAAAFMQVYREEAWYLERTAPWVERVGIEYVRARLSDVDGRRLLRDRFIESQRHAQSDPWADRAGGADAHEFRALATVA
jgi:nitrite reductase (NADH) large subunit